MKQHHRNPTTFLSRTFFALCLAWGASSAAFAQENARIIVRFKDQINLNVKTTRVQMQRLMLQNSIQSQQLFMQKLTQAMTQQSAMQTASWSGKGVRGLPGLKAHRYWMLNALYLEVPKSQLEWIRKFETVEWVMEDRVIQGFPAPSVLPSVKPDPKFAEKFTDALKKIEVPGARSVAAQNQTGLDGSGVRVGIIDSGVDGEHPDLKGKVIAFKDFLDKKSTTYDDAGHGTHVAGTIAGGSSSGTAIGVAPSARLIVGRAFGKGGRGTLAGILAAMQWIVDPDNNPNTDDGPKVINNSWGGGGADASVDPKDHPLCKAVQAWIGLGVIPVFSAGNEGPTPQTIGLPAACPQVLAVGASDVQDAVAPFSSRGPVVWKTGMITKPDMVAPGFKIVSAKVGGGYTEMSGTSMASPHVTGTVALMLQRKPNLTVQQAYQGLLKSVDRIGNDPNSIGKGRLNALKAVGE